MLSSQLFPPRSPHSKSSKTGSFDKPAFINMKKKTVMLSRYKCKTLRMTVNTKITIKTLFSVSNFHFCNEDMGSVTLPPPLHWPAVHTAPILINRLLNK